MGTAELALRLVTRSAEETEGAGAALARALTKPPGRALIVYLSGDLGAGKTTFARGFIRACGFVGIVRSPTYTLVECYATPALTIVHLDLYRLRSAAELEALGLRDLLLPGHVWLIEWPERGAGRLPPGDLHVSLGVEADGHCLKVVASTLLGREWLRDAAGAAGPYGTAASLS